jgi:hypothetical protein
VGAPPRPHRPWGRAPHASSHTRPSSLTDHTARTSHVPQRASMHDARSFLHDDRRSIRNNAQTVTDAASRSSSIFTPQPTHTRRPLPHPTSTTSHLPTPIPPTSSHLPPPTLPAPTSHDLLHCRAHLPPIPLLASSSSSAPPHTSASYTPTHGHRHITLSAIVGR